MARPMLEVGESGAVSFSRLADGRVQALCRYRDVDGVTRRVKAIGDNQARAERALKAKLKNRPGTGSSIDGVTPETSIGELSTLWLETLEGAPGTRAIYEHHLRRHILPALGGLRVRECTTGRIDRFLSQAATPELRTVTIRGTTKDVMMGGPAVARLCRTVLTGMFSVAVRHGALQGNPVREAKPAPRRRRDDPITNRSLTDDELDALRARAVAWQQAKQPGPRRTQDMVDAVDLYLATGMRSGELFALRWDDVDLVGDVPRLRVSGTVRRQKGEGLIRQAYPKSEAGERELLLPQFAVTMLRRRKIAQTPNPLRLVFASRTGGLIEPNNWNRRWREIRGDEFAWVTAKSFRKTVATRIKKEIGLGHASAQLGHTSEDITERYYVERQKIAPDVRNILEQFGR